MGLLRPIMHQTPGVANSGMPGAFSNNPQFMAQLQQLMALQGPGAMGQVNYRPPPAPINSVNGLGAGQGSAPGGRPSMGMNGIGGMPMGGAGAHTQFYPGNGIPIGYDQWSFNPPPTRTGVG